MRETSTFGIPIFATVTLLACIVGPSPLEAKVPNPPAGERIPNPDTNSAFAEPVTELPATPAPQIEAFNLFPNQGEIPSGKDFSDQRFGYVLHGEARAAYESNLFIQPRNEQRDFIFSLAPGVAVGWGDFKSELNGPNSFRHRFERYVDKDFFYVDYSPSYTWYTDHSDLDTFDQAVRVEAEWTIRRLTLGLWGEYVTETVPVEDIGNRVKQKRLNATLTSRYDLGGKTSIEVNGYYDGLSYSDPGIDSREWRNEEWLNYQVLPKVKLGLGGTVAHVEREFGPAQNYQQARLRGVYELSEKLTMSLTGGVEWRQAEGIADRNDGVFAFDLAWTPFDGTYFFLEGYRRSVTANTEGSDYYVATGVLLQCRQRFYRRFFAELTVQYENAGYQDPAGSPNAGRSDDLFIIRPGVGFDLASWANCEITGEYRQNDSSDAQRGFDATTAMVRFNLMF